MWIISFSIVSISKWTDCWRIKNPQTLINTIAFISQSILRRVRQRWQCARYSLFRNISNGVLETTCQRWQFAQYPIYFVTFLECLAPLAEPLVGSRTLCLEPHALHLIEIVHSRHTLLEHTHGADRRNGNILLEPRS